MYLKDAHRFCSLEIEDRYAITEKNFSILRSIADIVRQLETLANCSRKMDPLPKNVNRFSLPVLLQLCSGFRRTIPLTVGI